MRRDMAPFRGNPPQVAVHTDEAARLACLRRLNILDTPPEAALDDITRTIADYFSVPVALITLVDEDRQWFKSKVGLTDSETPRDVSFCHHAIQGTDVFVVDDALEDTRFSNNPLVTEDPKIRFYAGAPLRVAGGIPIGTLCIVDMCPRSFNSTERRRLAHFATVAAAVIEDIHENSQILERLASNGLLKEKPID